MTKVAVYGSLRKGLGNHRLLEHATFIGKDQIPNFEMYSLGAFPFIRPSETTNLITIEVYEVDSDQFARLDMLEGYPSFYDRKLVNTEYGEAWIYFIDQSPRDHDHVVEGDWVEYLKERNNGY